VGANIRIIIAFAFDAYKLAITIIQGITRAIARRNCVRRDDAAKKEHTN
jgi:hypothetical protein